MSSANSPSPLSGDYFITGGTPTYFSSLSLKATILYIGLSLGVLLVILVVLTITLVLCIRPSRRRREVLANLQRQRAAALEAAKAELTEFKPQIRQFPVLIVQPDKTQLAYGRAESSSGAWEAAAAMASAADPEDLEKGESSTHSSRSPEQAADSQDSKQVHFNPLTHYLTERLPHHFTAIVER